MKNGKRLKMYNFGDVILASVQFTNTFEIKKRPALVLADLEGNDVVLCQITSEARFDKDSLKLKASDFKKGKLSVVSMIRPNKLFTADISTIHYKVGSLKIEKINKTIETLIRLIRG